ncbi:unnamed protein product [Prorocentrum cordatum]|uniref:Uncharacterized protein n=1 Tax=Prorocentrum cordatum TaxID=2364126 RepID=A0ABN9XEP8_9DINO|nr:unnamed protein product [Polarella glacialis]
MKLWRETPPPRRAAFQTPSRLAPQTALLPRAGQGREAGTGRNGTRETGGRERRVRLRRGVGKECIRPSDQTLNDGGSSKRRCEGTASIIQPIEVQRDAKEVDM